MWSLCGSKRRKCWQVRCEILLLPSTFMLYDACGSYTVTVPVRSHAPAWAPCWLPAPATGKNSLTILSPTRTSSDIYTSRRFVRCKPCWSF